ncbi:hypothetical protein P4822_14880, partial [Listeria monocytogenes]|nr:hypothetical protein [Listeria monocytogenes]
MSKPSFSASTDGKDAPLKIEKGVPIPNRQRRGKFNAMKNMEIGDSVFIKDAQTAHNATQTHL